MIYWKILESFLLKTLFSKDEYNVNSKLFNPLKLIVIIVLVLNVVLTFYMFIKLNKIYATVETECPVVLNKIQETTSEVHITLPKIIITETKK